MTIHHSSLRETTLSGIGNFLFEEKFITTPIAREGILHLLNLISDYYEEGTRLFPEVVIMNNLNLLKTIPSRVILLYEGELTVLAFINSIKLCAPLAKFSHSGIPALPSFFLPIHYPCRPYLIN